MVNKSKAKLFKKKIMIEMETGRKLVGEQKEYIKMKREKTIEDRELNFDDDDEGIFNLKCDGFSVRCKTQRLATPS